MANLFYPDVNQLSKSSEFADVSSKFREEGRYPDGKIPVTKPEKWVRRKKKLVKNKMRKQKKKRPKSLSPINIDELKKRVKKKPENEEEPKSESKEKESEESKSKEKMTNISDSTKKSSKSTAKVGLIRK